MTYVQNGRMDVLVGFLHTYGLKWSEDSTRVSPNNGVDEEQLTFRLYPPLLLSLAS